MNLTELAKNCGVSIATVSRAFKPDAYVKPEVRKRILKFASECNYRPNVVAQSLKTNISHHVGFIIAHRRPQDNIASMQPHIKTICGISEHLEAHNYTLILSMGTKAVSAANEGPVLPKMLRERHIAGLIVLMDMWTELRDEIIKMNLPCVAVNSAPLEGVSTINIDEQNGAMMLTEHFIKNGHGRIAFLNSEIIGANNFRSKLYPLGYLQALTKHSLTPMPGWEEGHVLDNNLHSLFSRPKPPTALIAYDDNLARAAMRWLKKNTGNIKASGKVTIGSCHDMGQSEFLLEGLTRLVPPYEELAQNTVEVLLEIMTSGAGKSPEASTILTLQPKLVIGDYSINL